MKLMTPWVKHLLHRRCRWCHEEGRKAGYLKGRAEGYVNGFHEAAVESDRRERLIRAGIDPDMADSLRRRIADSEDVAA